MPGYPARGAATALPRSRPHTTPPLPHQPNHRAPQPTASIVEDDAPTAAVFPVSLHTQLCSRYIGNQIPLSSLSCAPYLRSCDVVELARIFCVQSVFRSDSPLARVVATQRDVPSGAHHRRSTAPPAREGQAAPRPIDGAGARAEKAATGAAKKLHQSYMTPVATSTTPALPRDTAAGFRPPDVVDEGPDGASVPLISVTADKDVEQLASPFTKEAGDETGLSATLLVKVMLEMVLRNVVREEAEAPTAVDDGLTPPMRNLTTGTEVPDLPPEGRMQSSTLVSKSPSLQALKTLPGVAASSSHGKEDDNKAGAACRRDSVLFSHSLTQDDTAREQQRRHYEQELQAWVAPLSQKCHQMENPIVWQQCAAQQEVVAQYARCADHRSKLAASAASTPATTPLMMMTTTSASARHALLRTAPIPPLLTGSTEWGPSLTVTTITSQHEAARAGEETATGQEDQADQRGRGAASASAAATGRAASRAGLRLRTSSVVSLPSPVPATRRGTAATTAHTGEGSCTTFSVTGESIFTARSGAPPSVNEESAGQSVPVSFREAFQQETEEREETAAGATTSKRPSGHTSVGSADAPGGTTGQSMLQPASNASESRSSMTSTTLMDRPTPPPLPPLPAAATHDGTLSGTPPPASPAVTAAAAVPTVVPAPLLTELLLGPPAALSAALYSTQRPDSAPGEAASPARRSRRSHLTATRRSPTAMSMNESMHSGASGSGARPQQQQQRRSQTVLQIVCWSDVANNVLMGLETAWETQRPNLTYSKVATSLLEDMVGASLRPSKGSVAHLGMPIGASSPAYAGEEDPRDGEGEEEDEQQRRALAAASTGGMCARRQRPAQMSGETEGVRVHLLPPAAATAVSQLHGQSADHVLVSPSQQFIVTSSKDGAVKLWETGEGRFVRTLLHVGTAWVLHLCFVHGGHRLFIATSAADVVVLTFPAGLVMARMKGCISATTAITDPQLLSIASAGRRFGQRTGDYGRRKVSAKPTSANPNMAVTGTEDAVAESAGGGTALEARPIVGYVAPTAVSYAEEVSCLFFGTMSGMIGCVDLSAVLSRGGLQAMASGFELGGSLRVVDSVAAHVGVADRRTARSGAGGVSTSSSRSSNGCQRVCGVFYSELGGCVVSAGQDGGLMRTPFTAAVGAAASSALSAKQSPYGFGTPAPVTSSTAASNVGGGGGGGGGSAAATAAVAATLRPIRFLVAEVGGRRFLSVHSDRRVALWNVNRGSFELTHVFSQFPFDVMDACFVAPLQQVIILLEDRTIEVMDERGSRALAVIAPPKDLGGRVEDMSGVTLQSSINDTDGAVAYVAGTNRLVCALRGPMLYALSSMLPVSLIDKKETPPSKGGRPMSAQPGGQPRPAQVPTIMTSPTSVPRTQSSVLQPGNEEMATLPPSAASHPLSPHRSPVATTAPSATQDTNNAPLGTHTHDKEAIAFAALQRSEQRLRPFQTHRTAVVGLLIDPRCHLLHTLSTDTWTTWDYYTGMKTRGPTEVPLLAERELELPARGSRLTSAGWSSLTAWRPLLLLGTRGGRVLSVDPASATLVSGTWPLTLNASPVSHRHTLGGTDVSAVSCGEKRTLLCCGRVCEVRQYDLSTNPRPTGEERFVSMQVCIPAPAHTISTSGEDSGDNSVGGEEGVRGVAMEGGTVGQVANAGTRGRHMSNNTSDGPAMSGPAVRSAASATITACCVVRDSQLCLGTSDTRLFFYRMVDQSSPAHGEVLLDERGEMALGRIVKLHCISFKGQDVLLAVVDTGALYVYSYSLRRVLGRYYFPYVGARRDRQAAAGTDGEAPHGLHYFTSVFVLDEGEGPTNHVTSGVTSVNGSGATTPVPEGAAAQRPVTLFCGDSVGYVHVVSLGTVLAEVTTIPVTAATTEDGAEDNVPCHTLRVTASFRAATSGVSALEVVPCHFPITLMRNLPGYVNSIAGDDGGAAEEGASTTPAGVEQEPRRCVVFVGSFDGNVRLFALLPRPAQVHVQPMSVAKRKKSCVASVTRVLTFSEEGKGTDTAESAEGAAPTESTASAAKRGVVAVVEKPEEAASSVPPHAPNDATTMQDQEVDAETCFGTPLLVLLSALTSASPDIDRPPRQLATLAPTAVAAGADGSSVAPGESFGVPLAVGLFGSDTWAISSVDSYTDVEQLRRMAEPAEIPLHLASIQKEPGAERGRHGKTKQPSPIGASARDGEGEAAAADGRNAIPTEGERATVLWDVLRQSHHWAALTAAATNTTADLPNRTGPSTAVHTLKSPPRAGTATQTTASRPASANVVLGVPVKHNLAAPRGAPLQLPRQTAKDLVAGSRPATSKALDPRLDQTDEADLHAWEAARGFSSGGSGTHPVLMSPSTLSNCQRPQQSTSAGRERPNPLLRVDPTVTLVSATLDMMSLLSTLREAAPLPEAEEQKAGDAGGDDDDDDGAQSPSIEEEEEREKVDGLHKASSASSPKKSTSNTGRGARDRPEHSTTKAPAAQLDGLLDGTGTGVNAEEEAARTTSWGSSLSIMAASAEAGDGALQASSSAGSTFITDGATGSRQRCTASCVDTPVATSQLQPSDQMLLDAAGRRVDPTGKNADARSSSTSGGEAMDPAAAGSGYTLARGSLDGSAQVLTDLFTAPCLTPSRARIAIVSPPRGQRSPYLTPARLQQSTATTATAGAAPCASRPTERVGEAQREMDLIRHVLQGVDGAEVQRRYDQMMLSHVAGLLDREICPPSSVGGTGEMRRPRPVTAAPSRLSLSSVGGMRPRRALSAASPSVAVSHAVSLGLSGLVPPEPTKTGEAKEKPFIRIESPNVIRGAAASGSRGGIALGTYTAQLLRQWQTRSGEPLLDGSGMVMVRTNLACAGKGNAAEDEEGAPGISQGCVEGKHPGRKGGRTRGASTTMSPPHSPTHRSAGAAAVTAAASTSRAATAADGTSSSTLALETGRNSAHHSHHSGLSTRQAPSQVMAEKAATRLTTPGGGFGLDLFALTMPPKEGSSGGPAYSAQRPLSGMATHMIRVSTITLPTRPRTASIGSHPERRSSSVSSAFGVNVGGPRLRSVAQPMHVTLPSTLRSDPAHAHAGRRRGGPALLARHSNA